MPNKVVKKIPNTESDKRVHCVTGDKTEYFVTECLAKQRFSLWKVVPDGYEQISTAKTPTDLYDLIPWGTTEGG